MLTPNRKHHVVFIVDGRPCIVTTVVDGILCDGNGRRQYGWSWFGWYDKKRVCRVNLPGDVTGGPKLKPAPSFNGTLHRIRIYDRYLRTSEAVGNRQASKEE
jgi:hypothetical protein